MISRDVPNPAQIKDLPAILGGSQNFWYRKAKAKQIPHYMVGNRYYFTLKDLQEIQRSMRVAPVMAGEETVSAGGLSSRSQARHRNKAKRTVA